MAAADAVAADAVDAAADGGVGDAVAAAVVQSSFLLRALDSRRLGRAGPRRSSRTPPCPQCSCLQQPIFTYKSESQRSSGCLGNKSFF